MKKYLSIFKISFIDSLQYGASIICKFIGFTSMLYILTCLWLYIYKGETTIMGYTFPMIIWYIILGEAIYANGKDRDLQRGIQEDILNGDIAYKINKPYFYPLYIFSRFIGNTFLKTILTYIASIIIGFCFVGKLETFNIKYFPLMFITIFNAYVINAFIRITIKELSFWFEDTNPLMWVYDKLFLIFGSIYPLEMLPKSFHPYLKFIPTYTTVYGPTRLVVNFDMSMFFDVLTVQIITMILVIMACCFVYKKGARRVNVNGG